MPAPHHHREGHLTRGQPLGVVLLGDPVVPNGPRLCAAVWGWCRATIAGAARGCPSTSPTRRGGPGRREDHRRDMIVADLGRLHRGEPLRDMVRPALA